MALLALQAPFAQLPPGRIALLPVATAGAAANFAAITGLRKKWTALSESQLVNPASFNASNYAVVFYLSGEHYVKTVTTPGDGKSAITRFLAGGGTLVLLATGPFPFYYGDGPGDQPGPADVLLPALGLPINLAFEQAPPNLLIQPYPNQTILHSEPATFPFPPGDPRLRAINRAQISATDRYIPLLRVTDTLGRNYGDAAGCLELHGGPAKGGRILYIWSSLLSGPQGSGIMADAVSWILNGTVRPPSLGTVEVAAPTRAVLGFEALANLRYWIESRESLSRGAWSLAQEVPAAFTNRVLWLTNTLSTPGDQYFRLGVRP